MYFYTVAVQKWPQCFIHSFNHVTVILRETHNVLDKYWPRIEKARCGGSVVKYGDIK